MKILAVEFSSECRSAALLAGRRLARPRRRKRRTARHRLGGAGPATGRVRAGGSGRRSPSGSAPAPTPAFAARLPLPRAGNWAGASNLIGVSSVECLAAQAEMEKISGPVNIVIDAQRNEFYLARYESWPGARRLVEPLRLAALAEIEKRTPPAKKSSGRTLPPGFRGPSTFTRTPRCWAAWRRGGTILFPAKNWSRFTCAKPPLKKRRPRASCPDEMPRLLRIVQITPGAGKMFCGACLRDNALVTALRKLGHAAMMAPLYLPLTLDEEDQSAGTPIFFSGINVYLEQQSALFRHAPAWLHQALASPALLKLASGAAAKTRPDRFGRDDHFHAARRRGQPGAGIGRIDRLAPRRKAGRRQPCPTRCWSAWRGASRRNCACRCCVRCRGRTGFWTRCRRRTANWPGKPRRNARRTWTCSSPPAAISRT